MYVYLLLNFLFLGFFSGQFSVNTRPLSVSSTTSRVTNLPEGYS